jgi:hypothetical protein
MCQVFCWKPCAVMSLFRANLDGGKLLPSQKKRGISSQHLSAEPRSWLCDRPAQRLLVAVGAEGFEVGGVVGCAALVERYAVVDVEPVCAAAALALVVVAGFDLYSQLLEPC